MQSFEWHKISLFYLSVILFINPYLYIKWTLLSQGVSISDFCHLVLWKTRINNPLTTIGTRGVCCCHLSLRQVCFLYVTKSVVSVKADVIRQVNSFTISNTFQLFILNLWSVNSPQPENSCTWLQGAHWILVMFSILWWWTSLRSQIEVFCIQTQYWFMS